MAEANAWWQLRQASLFSQLASSRRVQLFMRPNETPWERPLAQFGVLAATDEEHAEAAKADCEQNHIDSDRDWREGPRIVAGKVIALFARLSSGRSHHKFLAEV